MARVLVTGGAGYIGSHMMKVLVEANHEAVALDNLSSGHADAVCFGELVVADLRDQDSIKEILRNGQFDTVMHFAGSIEVSESMANPAKYYQNNVVSTMNLANAMREEGCKKLIFSSTAAVYGAKGSVPIDETSATHPSSVYGRTKLMAEEFLRDFQSAYGMRVATLRYFNAAGADPDGLLGERHNPETHLIPLAIRSALESHGSISIFGDDYDTPDGTCIRDYVHVTDLCYAHLLAMQYLDESGSCNLNLGLGYGFSVLEIIEAVEKISDVKFKRNICERRSGDPAYLVSDASLARKLLGWNPRFSDINMIVESAYYYSKKSLVPKGVL